MSKIIPARRIKWCCECGDYLHSRNNYYCGATGEIIPTPRMIGQDCPLEDAPKEESDGEEA